MPRSWLRSRRTPVLLTLALTALLAGSAGPVSATTTPPATVSGKTLYVQPVTTAGTEAARVRTTDPTRAALLDRIATRPQAVWYGDWNGVSSVAGTVGQYVGAAAAQGKMPVLVLYAIPQRDCGGMSGGGFSPRTYESWVREVARGIAGRPATVVLEPDAISLMDCLSTADRWTRLGLLKDAVRVLNATGRTAVYIDAGHSNWDRNLPRTAFRLREAGALEARGIAVNVSNFNWTRDEVAYGEALAAEVSPHTRVVIDTSRNGQGPASGTLAWCNPAGRGLGPAPTTSTGRWRVDAYLWVKRPGESDGHCNRNEPAAGQWFSDYAVGLAQRAA